LEINSRRGMVILDDIDAQLLLPDHLDGDLTGAGGVDYDVDLRRAIAEGVGAEQLRVDVAEAADDIEVFGPEGDANEPGEFDDVPGGLGV